MNKNGGMLQFLTGQRANGSVNEEKGE